MTDKQLQQEKVTLVVIHTPGEGPKSYSIIQDGAILIRNVTAEQGRFFLKGFQAAKPSLQGLAIESEVLHLMQ